MSEEQNKEYPISLSNTEGVWILRIGDDGFLEFNREHERLNTDELAESFIKTVESHQFFGGYNVGELIHKHQAAIDRIESLEYELELRDNMIKSQRDQLNSR